MDQEIQEGTMYEQEPKEFIITEVAPMGFGNPDSSISRTKQLESGELSSEVDVSAQELIKSGEVIVAVSETDDGCIDGRPAIEITYRDENSEFKTVELDNGGHERAKVAGGGYVTGLSMVLGVGSKGETAEADILRLGEKLSEQGVYCGAHTGPHKHNGETTDCGANDKIEPILRNALKLETTTDGESYQILPVVQKLIETAGLTFNEETFNTVATNWQNTLNDADYFGKGNGETRLQAMADVQEAARIEQGSPKPPAVTKNLRGDHNEDYIVVNYVGGHTFSQGKFHDTLREQFSEADQPDLAQAFVVDAWRIVELAQAAAEEDVETAIYAGVMYQVATAATLTDGSLKIFAVTEKQ